MGHNAVVVVMVDALHIIEKDQNFGEKLVSAVRLKSGRKEKTCDVTARYENCTHANAATVLSCEHADLLQLVEVGRNYGEVVSISYDSLGKHLHALAKGTFAERRRAIADLTEMGRRYVSKR